MDHNLCRLTTLSRDQACELASELAAIAPWRRLAVSEQALIKTMLSREPDVTSYSVLYNDDLAGLATLRRGWLFGDYLKLFAMRPACQQRGLGRMALELVCSDVRARGGSNLWACVSAFNGAAITFYERNGFETIGKLNDLVKIGEDEILIRRQL